MCVKTIRFKGCRDDLCVMAPIGRRSSASSVALGRFSISILNKTILAARTPSAFGFEAVGY
jgi:hypothetical protein